MSAHGFYVTGTDTGVGKTVVSIAFLQALRNAGNTAIGMKPVASGCVATEHGWRNDDALALQAASIPRPDYDLINPFALPAATAPQIAAAQVGVRVSLPPIVSAYRRLAGRADTVVVEGVGGWLAPLSDALDQSALVRELELSVILVVGLRLGCLNHARLSARAIVGDGLRLAGWIGNRIDPQLSYALEYADLLRASLTAPCLGWLPHAPSATATELAACLHLPR